MSIALESEIASAVTAPEPPPYSSDRPLYPLSVEQYHQMIAAGVFKDSPRLELVEGYLLAMSPIGPPHAYSVSKTQLWFLQRVSPTWIVRMQLPLTLTHSELEPDICVVRGTWDDFKAAHAKPVDAGLVIEVSESTLPSDRRLKAALYAGAGVVEYWIVNLVDRQVEIHKGPRKIDLPRRGEYQSREIFGEGGLVPVVLDGRSIGELAVSELLP